MSTVSCVFGAGKDRLLSAHVSSNHASDWSRMAVESLTSLGSDSLSALTRAVDRSHAVSETYHPSCSGST